MSAVGYSVVTGATGTKTTSASASNISITTAGGQTIGDLIIAAAYVAGADCSQVRDNEDGWIILSSNYDTTNAFGIILAALIARRAGAITYTGLSLPGSGAYTAQNSIFSVGNSLGQRSGCFQLNLAGAHGSTQSDWFNASASGTALDIPEREGAGYSQYVEIAARGYTNDGSNPVETVGSVTGWQEIFDVGQNSPAHGLVLNLRNAGPGNPPATNVMLNNQSDASGTSAVSASVTNRCGVRVTIPIIGNVNASAMRRRHLSARRFG